MFRYGSKLGEKWAEVVQLIQSSCHEVTSEFFATNALNPSHWILNSCFGAFLSVWVHLGPFHYCMKLMKLGAKRAECGAFIAKVRATKPYQNFSQ